MGKIQNKAILYALICCISGFAPFVLSPPVGWIPLQLISWIPALWLFSQLHGKRAFFTGWLIGFLQNLAALYWISETLERFSNLPWYLNAAATMIVCAAYGLYLGVFALGYHRIKHLARNFWPFAIAAWFSACEFLNPQLFPFYQGVGWYDFPEVFHIVSLAGITSLSFIVLAINAVILQGLELYREQALLQRVVVVNALACIALIAIAMSWSGYRLNLISKHNNISPKIKVAVYQPNMNSIARSEMIRKGYKNYLKLFLDDAQQILAKEPGIRVLVWPEAVLRYPPDHRNNQPVRDFAARHGVEIWSGGTFRADKSRRNYGRFNSAYRYLDGGQVDRHYAKRFLLPFGEYLPLKEVIPAFKNIRGPGNNIPGTDQVIFDLANQSSFAFLICYEVILNHVVRDAVNQGAEFIVNLTNDSWFGDTHEPHQHLMLTKAQAVMHGVSIVRATNTGISTVITADGLDQGQIELFSQGYLVKQVPVSNLPTPYNQLGDWFAWLSVATSLFGLAFSLFKTNRHN